MKEPTKQAFLKTWPGGYTENFEVYTAQTGGLEEEIVARCLTPFIKADGTVLEIGCGNGFWTNKYLLPGFARVIGLDLIPLEWVKVHDSRFTYIEVPDRNYSCHGVVDASIDFAWSFGCFCHLPLEAIQHYLKSIIRVLKPGGKASLYFSNTERRPDTATKESDSFDPDTQIIWCNNNWRLTESMMREAGFIAIQDMLPVHKDTLAYGEKPK